MKYTAKRFELQISVSFIVDGQIFLRDKIRRGIFSFVSCIAFHGFNAFTVEPSLPFPVHTSFDKVNKAMQTVLFNQELQMIASKYRLRKLIPPVKPEVQSVSFRDFRNLEAFRDSFIKSVLYLLVAFSCESHPVSFSMHPEK